MNYNEKLKKSIKGLFLLDFREATTQQQFLIEKTGHLTIFHKTNIELLRLGDRSGFCGNPNKTASQALEN